MPILPRGRFKPSSSFASAGGTPFSRETFGFTPLAGSQRFSFSECSRTHFAKSSRVANTTGPFSHFSDLKDVSAGFQGLEFAARVEEVAEIYVVAWRAALTQEGRFLAPRAVFEGVHSGVDLLREVCALSPFLWVAEKKLKEDSMKAELRNCYRAMKDEADAICQVEFLAAHGTSKHLKQMDQILTVCRRRRYAHESVYELEQRKLQLESKAADHLLTKELGGRAAAYRTEAGEFPGQFIQLNSTQTGRRQSVHTLSDLPSKLGLSIPTLHITPLPGWNSNMIQAHPIGTLTPHGSFTRPEKDDCKQVPN